MRFLLVVVLLAGCRSAAGVDDGTATVVEVVDGDTIVVDVDGRDERVRLLGIDTPEVFVDPGEAPECYGPEASARTKQLLAPGTTVRLERDVVARDDYGRLLASVSRTSDGLLVNDDLLGGGFAEMLIIAPNGVMADRFRASTRAAEAAGLGLWGACPG